MLSLALLIGACRDPPDPPPVSGPAGSAASAGSTAPWVEWRDPDAPVRGPVARVVDAPGGPVDRVVADIDVTTFLNDRFHPIFRRESREQPRGTVMFLDGCGCPLTPPLTPPDAATFVAVANDVIVRPAARACEGRPFVEVCPAIHGAD